MDKKTFKPLRNVWQSQYYRLFTSLINSERNHTKSSNLDVSQIGLEIYEYG